MSCMAHILNYINRIHTPNPNPTLQKKTDKKQKTKDLCTDWKLNIY